MIINISANSENGEDVFLYKNNRPFITSLIIENVSPVPNINWSMNNKSLQGYAIIARNILHYSEENMQITDKLIMEGSKDYDNQILMCHIKMYETDEEGIISIIYNNPKSARLSCLDCESSTSTSTSLSTTPMKTTSNVETTTDQETTTENPTTTEIETTTEKETTTEMKTTTEPTTTSTITTTTSYNVSVIF